MRRMTLFVVLGVLMGLATTPAAWALSIVNCTGANVWVKIFDIADQQRLVALSRYALNDNHFSQDDRLDDARLLNVQVFRGGSPVLILLNVDRNANLTIHYEPDREFYATVERRRRKFCP